MSTKIKDLKRVLIWSNCQRRLKLFHEGLFRVDKYLPNFVNLKIKMRRSSPAFALVTSLSTASNDDYQIVFDEVIFYCKK